MVSGGGADRFEGCAGACPGRPAVREHHIVSAARAARRGSSMSILQMTSPGFLPPMYAWAAAPAHAFILRAPARCFTTNPQPRPRGGYAATTSVGARDRRHARSLSQDTPDPMGTATEMIHGAAGPFFTADEHIRRNQVSVKDVGPVVQSRVRTGEPIRAAIAQSQRRGIPFASRSLIATPTVRTGKRPARKRMR